ncbi:MAG: shikimate kinase [Bacteroidaceae bacterium]|nr:shikimate kinase [Bacteroidaceae bacterium]
MKRIILIGYMGAGKTTLGKVLARELNLEFIDLDWYIENRFHQSVTQLFATRGEEGFRQIERNMLHEVAEFENVIISSGGGTPCFFDNMEYMNQQGLTVYLKATPETLRTHLRMGKQKRPLVAQKNDEELDAFIHESLNKREPFYNQARLIFDTGLLDNGTRIQETVQLLVETIRHSLNTGVQG